MRQRAPKKPAAERRQMIIESAQEVFAQEGYANAGTAEIARAVGVTSAAVYRYFPSKRDLYLAALRDAGPRLLSVISEIGKEVSDPLETIRRVGLGYYDRVTGRTPYSRLWFQALGDVGDSDVREAIASNFTAIVEVVAAELERGKKMGLVRAELDTRIAAWQFMAIGLTFDLLHQLDLDAELNRAKVEAWGSLFIDSLRSQT